MEKKESWTTEHPLSTELNRVFHTVGIITILSKKYPVQLLQVPVSILNESTISKGTQYSSYQSNSPKLYSTLQDEAS